MDPTARAMFMGASGAGIPIGTFLEGGYFAGYISHTADGNATHGLIVAPAASGSSSSIWKTTETLTSNPAPNSDYDGALNTFAMVGPVNPGRAAQHPAADYCSSLNINGYNDWYLPARYELEIAYYNLKPGTQSNNTDFGANIYAVPQRLSNYTAGNPTQTSVAAFQSDGPEEFIRAYTWSSTQSSATNAWTFIFTTGFSSGSIVQIDGGKSSGRRVRAFRKFAL